MQVSPSPKVSVTTATASAGPLAAPELATPHVQTAAPLPAQLEQAEACLAALRRPKGVTFRGVVLGAGADPQAILLGYSRVLAVARQLARRPELAAAVAAYTAGALDELPADLRALGATVVGTQAPSQGTMRPRRTRRRGERESLAPTSAPVGEQSRPSRQLIRQIEAGDPEAFRLSDAGLEILAGVLRKGTQAHSTLSAVSFLTAYFEALDRMEALGFSTEKLLPVNACFDGAIPLVTTDMLAEPRLSAAVARLLRRSMRDPASTLLHDGSTLQSHAAFAAVWARIERICWGATDPLPRRGTAEATRDAFACLCGPTGDLLARAFIEALHNPQVDPQSLVREALVADPTLSRARIDYASLTAQQADGVCTAATQDAHLGLSALLFGLFVRNGEAALYRRITHLGYTQAQAETWCNLAHTCHTLPQGALGRALAPATLPEPDYFLLPMRVALGALAALEPATYVPLFESWHSEDPSGAARALIDRAALESNAASRMNLGLYLLNHPALEEGDIHAAAAHGRHGIVFSPQIQSIREAAEGCVSDTPLDPAQADNLSDTLLRHKRILPLADLVQIALGHIDDITRPRVMPLQAADNLLGGVRPHGNKARPRGTWVELGGTALQVNDAADTNRHLIPSAEQSRLVPTPTSLRTMRVVAGQWRCATPVLLEGPTGSGKSLVIKHLAHRTQTPLHRVIITEDTEVQDLIGRDVPGGITHTADDLRALSDQTLSALADSLGVASAQLDRRAREACILQAESEPHWVDGPVARAARLGEAVLLVNVNQAHPQVIECLNGLLDADKRLVLTANRSEVIEPSKHFRIFATQNPRSYAGRAMLSKAFLSRWTKFSCARLADTDLLILLEDLLPGADFQKTRADLLTVHSSLVKAADDGRIGRIMGDAQFSPRHLQRVGKRLRMFGHSPDIVCREVREVYEGMASGSHERNAFNAVLHSVWPTARPAYIDLKLEEHPTYWRLGDVRVERLGYEDPRVPGRSAELETTARTLSGLYRTLKAIQVGETPMLVGERAAGKGVIVRLIAMLYEQPYARHGVNEATDSAEIFGGYRAYGWQDGLLLQSARATQTPAVFLLDEPNLGCRALLEGLIGLMDDHTQVSVLGKGGGEVIALHPQFKLAGAMNPPTEDDDGRDPLSPALLDRVTVVPLDGLDDPAELTAITHFHAIRMGVPTALADAILELHHWTVQQRQGHVNAFRHVDEHAELSLRTLELALTFAAHHWDEKGPHKTFEDITESYYLGALDPSLAPKLRAKAESIANEGAH